MKIFQEFINFEGTKSQSQEFAHVNIIVTRLSDN